MPPDKKVVVHELVKGVLKGVCCIATAEVRRGCIHSACAEIHIHDSRPLGIITRAYRHLAPDQTVFILMKTPHPAFVEYELTDQELRWNRPRLAGQDQVRLLVAKKGHVLGGDAKPWLLSA
jgi:hypothetical protein